jgi:SsrA-binding protein
MAGERTRTVVSNRRALHDYEIDERFEAGLELRGTEVKSLRAGHASIAEAYGQVRDGEVFLVGATIQPYTQANRANHRPDRDRRLLLHAREIERMRQRTAERGLTLVPLRIYFAGGRAKLEIALARGKGVRDKRDTIAQREAGREIERALKRASED